jgi:hypothetical protein
VIGENGIAVGEMSRLLKAAESGGERDGAGREGEKRVRALEKAEREPLKMKRRRRPGAKEERNGGGRGIAVVIAGVTETAIETTTGSVAIAIERGSGIETVGERRAETVTAIETARGREIVTVTMAINPLHTSTAHVHALAAAASILPPRRMATPLRKTDFVLRWVRV